MYYLSVPKYYWNGELYFYICGYTFTINIILRIFTEIQFFSFCSYSPETDSCNGIRVKADNLCMIIKIKIMPHLDHKQNHEISNKAEDEQRIEDEILLQSRHPEYVINI